jgi:hypothetical protein
MRVLANEYDVLSGPLGGGVRKLMRDYTQVVIQTFKELSPGKSIQELRAATFGLFGMLTWVDQWHRPQRDLSVDRLAEEFTSIFLGHFLGGTPTGAENADGEQDDSSADWSRKNTTSSILSGPGF